MATQVPEQEKQRKTYVQPTLTVYGTMRNLTRNVSGGGLHNDGGGVGSGMAKT